MNATQLSRTDSLLGDRQWSFWDWLIGIALFSGVLTAGEVAVVLIATALTRRLRDASPR